MLGRMILAASICATISWPGYVLADDQDSDLNAQVKVLTEQVKAEGPRFLLAGKLEAGQHEKYSINGEDFSTDDDTVVFGEKVVLGENVEVAGNMGENGKKIATKIVFHTESDKSFKLPPEPFGADSSKTPVGPSGTVPAPVGE